MTTTTRTRRTAAWAGTALVAALLPLVGPAAPAHAAGCTSETPVPLPPSACDDTTPPETTLSPMTPSPNAEGWTRADDVTFAFEAVATDPGDVDAMKLECRLVGPSQAHDWQDCTSPKTYTDLTDGADNPAYTFSVRAYDSADRAIDYDDPSTPLVNEDEVADEDATPESSAWRQDTLIPNSFVFGGPVDTDGSGWPIARKPRVSYTLDSSERSSSYRCQLDGRNVSCDKGQVTLGGLTGGDKVFQVKVTDPAGNEDPSAATKQFTVPYDLTSAKNWKLVKAKGTFKGRQLQTRLKGARIKFRAQNVRELRFLAPAGSGLGKVRVRVGSGYWKTFDLGRGKATRARYYVVRDAASPLFSGPILIESLSAGKPVRIDALVFPPG